MSLLSFKFTVKNKGGQKHCYLNLYFGDLEEIVTEGLLSDVPVVQNVSPVTFFSCLTRVNLTRQMELCFIPPIFLSQLCVSLFLFCFV